MKINIILNGHYSSQINTNTHKNDWACLLQRSWKESSRLIHWQKENIPFFMMNGRALPKRVWEDGCKRVKGRPTILYRISLWTNYCVMWSLVSLSNCVDNSYSQNLSKTICKVATTPQMSFSIGCKKYQWDG